MMATKDISFTEAELIEMEFRFRRLEGVIRRADLILAEEERKIQGRIAKAEENLPCPDLYTYDSVCREIRGYERNRDRVQGIRGDLERAAEACRGDLTTLVDQARRG